MGLLARLGVPLNPRAAAERNAEAEGVRGRVELADADARDRPFEAGGSSEWSRLIAAAPCGHVAWYRTRRAVPCPAGHVRPLPEGPSRCELNSGGATARLWMARDARAGQDD
jgi:hypothetical protein